ncbi:MAG: hypothetical protein ACFFDN_44100 [Candidatus Hodarchaeota archaeon]
MADNDELNEESIKENLKKKIKEKLKKEILEEIYLELKAEEEDITSEISSIMAKESTEPSIKLTQIPSKIPVEKEEITININSILKIASHALKYANSKIPRDRWVEVFGLLAGELKNNDVVLHIEDAYPLGHGTAISWKLKDPQSHEKAYRDIKKKKLFISGWYHSHPSYGLFMSPEDIHNHSIYQTLWKRSIALVIDPYQIDGTSAGFDIFRANLKTKKWYQVPYSIEGGLDVRMLPEILKFMDPIIEGKAAYLEYDEE